MPNDEVGSRGSKPLPTKKALKEGGYRTADDWLRKCRVPKESEFGVTLKNERYFLKDQTEELISRSKAQTLGLTVPETIQAITCRAQVQGTWRDYDGFRISDCKKKRPRNSKPPVEIDLLLATWTVNRTAKRYRDSASKYYERRIHGFASSSKTIKEHLYRLKDNGIREAFRSKRLTFSGMHGGFALYEGEGYSFHATFVPEEVATTLAENVDEPIFNPSRQKTKKEGRLKDAKFTLSKCRTDQTGFRSIPPSSNFERDQADDPTEFDSFLIADGFDEDDFEHSTEF
jgi:hypothetical protein